MKSLGSITRNELNLSNTTPLYFIDTPFIGMRFKYLFHVFKNLTHLLKQICMYVCICFI